MPLKKHLIEVTGNSLIACRECHTIADISINHLGVRLLCPHCYVTLGIWTTPNQALDDIAAFVTNRKAGSRLE